MSKSPSQPTADTVSAFRDATRLDASLKPLTNSGIRDQEAANPARNTRPGTVIAGDPRTSERLGGHTDRQVRGDGGVAPSTTSRQTIKPKD